MVVLNCLNQALGDKETFLAYPLSFNQEGSLCKPLYPTLQLERYSLRPFSAVPIQGLPQQKATL